MSNLQGLVQVARILHLRSFLRSREVESSVERMSESSCPPKCRRQPAHPRVLSLNRARFKSDFRKRIKIPVIRRRFVAEETRTSCSSISASVVPACPALQLLLASIRHLHRGLSDRWRARPSWPIVCCCHGLPIGKNENVKLNESYLCIRPRREVCAIGSSQLTRRRANEPSLLYGYLESNWWATHGR